MDINAKIAEELSIRPAQVEATVKLIDEGNTIPFIARYRKEVTGALNDEVLRNLHERLQYLRNLEEKKESVLSSIGEQGKLTDELREKILSAETLVVVDDLYRPYRPKRRTRATVAKEKGLEPLAEWLFGQAADRPVVEVAAEYVDEAKEVATAEDAIAGAKDIIAELISDEAAHRAYIRSLTEEKGSITSKAKDAEAQSVYEMYYDFVNPLKSLPGYRVLALNRGEKEKVLAVKVMMPDDEAVAYLEKAVIRTDAADVREALSDTVRDAYDRLIAPAIEREIRASLTEAAEDAAIKVFGKNLEQLLMQPPIAGKVVLGWDPAFRTGCKLAVVDETGKVLDTTVIFPTEPQNKVEESKRTVKKLIDKYHVGLISVGNGTASRESEAIIANMIKEVDAPVQYVIVNEAGASVYSASKLATEEFPNFDVGQRSAASIARRLQDPLAELCKIEPQAIGVGQYQHDMNQKKLAEALSGVVEDSVNKVGVDLNTASVPLLSYVAGINKTLAKNIVEYREENGSFKTRKELLSVKKLGPKAFEQCAGFLRIRDGENALDATGVHPESYAVCEKLLAGLGHNAEDVRGGGLKGVSKEISSLAEKAAELGVGELTLADIVKELEKPGRDPREDMPKPILRSDVMDMSDLKPGMILKGTVRNIVDFGAFVDIGVHQDGLVHISRMTDRFIKHPLEVVSVGDVVEVEVVEVDAQKQRIGLSMLIGKETGDKPGTGAKAGKEKAAGGAGAPRKNRDGGRDRRKGDVKGDRRSKDERGRRSDDSFGSSIGDLLANLKF